MSWGRHDKFESVDFEKNNKKDKDKKQNRCDIWNASRSVSTDIQTPRQREVN